MRLSDNIKTPGEFLKWFRKNDSNLNIPHERVKFSNLCGLLVQGQIELGEVSVEETHRFWKCLKKNNYRRMPNKEEWKKINKESPRGMFLN